MGYPVKHGRPTAGPWIAIPIALWLMAIGQPSRGDWTRCGPDDALHVVFLAVDSREPQTVYATGSTSPMEDGTAAWKTTDGGQTWRRLDVGGATGHKEPGLVAIDPADSRTLYMTSGGYVLRSKDAGARWARLGAIADRRGALRVFAFIIDPLSSGVLYAGLGTQQSLPAGGLFKSVDGGSTWVALPVPSDRTVYHLLAVPEARGGVYAATSQGILRSIDGGSTWAEIGPEGVKARFMTMAVSPRDAQTLYAGTAGEGVFKTTDGGATWSASRKGLSYPGVYAIAVDPITPRTVWAGTSGGGVFRSTDAGATWHEQNDGLATTFVQSLAIAPTDPTVTYVGTIRGGVLRWTDKQDARSRSSTLGIRDPWKHASRPTEVRYGVGCLPRIDECAPRGAVVQATDLLGWAGGDE
jgi:photosystem II stability/assembly factor-like uncharacterized protein